MISDDDIVTVIEYSQYSEPTQAAMDELANQFEAFGFEDAKVKEIVKNKKVSISLSQLLKQVDDNLPSLDKQSRSLVHNLASHLKGQDLTNSEWIVTAIQRGDLKTNLQVESAFKYLSNDNATHSVEEMNQKSGVGIEVTPEQVDEQVALYLKQNEALIQEQRYKIVPKLFASVKALPGLKWADPKLFKTTIDKQILSMLGPKDERDTVKKPAKKNAGKGKVEKNKKNDASNPNTPQRTMFNEGFLGDLHKVGENPQAYPELMQEHLKVTGGKVRTRFPPEPNGYLHIGHSKAIMVNFGYAKYHDGVCYLRFDDTNPEAEAPEYFESIKRMVSWLGFTPWKITYSSDYFDKLYDLAEVLITKGHGYVCHCTAEEIKRGRGIKEDGTPGGERHGCIHRDQTIEHNLNQFRLMKNGHYQPGEAILRMKQDLTSPNPQMWDLIAYRVLNAPHPRTGDKWKIYPTYDFTHCLVDSFENITHSLCTTEFYLSRESYEWLCDMVHVFRPAQREYGRLNITGTVLSKRKIAKLVENKIVRGWNDPRLFTLEGIRRRGVPPGAILSFINTLGVTTSTTNIQVIRFESAIRKYLEDMTPRLMFILDPIEVVVDNLDDDYMEEVKIPYKTGSPKFGDRLVPFTNNFYIERSDFNENIEDKEFFRLTPNQPVGLIKVPFTVSFASIEKDPNGKIQKLHVTYNKDIKIKPKTFIQWVPVSAKHNSPLKIHETRVYNQLFKSENPAAVDDYLTDINPESEVIYKNSVVEHNFHDVISNTEKWVSDKVKSSELYVKEDFESHEVCRFQGMRVGYFTLDPESNKTDKIILNRIVSLKDNTSK